MSTGGDDTVDDIYQQVQRKYIEEICSIHYSIPKLETIQDVIQESIHITKTVHKFIKGHGDSDKVPPWAKKVIFKNSANTSMIKTRYDLIRIFVGFLVKENKLEARLVTLTKNEKKSYEILCNYIENNFFGGS